MLLLCFISCVAGGVVLKLTAPVIVPFTIALFLACAMYPLVSTLDKLRVPRSLSILLVVIVIGVGLCVFAAILFTSGRTILSRYPKYEGRLTEIYAWAAGFFELSYDERLTFFENLWGQLGVRSQVRNFAISFSNASIQFLKNAVMVVLFVVFFLLEAACFKEKVELAFAAKHSGQIKHISADVARQITRYLTAKTLISLATGAVVALGLSLIGLEFAVVWGLVQFILNFIPSLGSIAAGVAASVFALLQFWPEPGPVILVVAVMIGANTIIGNVLDPKIIGDHVGISPLVVLVSLTIWGWVWGFAGMILAVPMMVIIKIICENFPFLEPISILLGSRKATLVKKLAEAEKEMQTQELM
ncbi:MAG: AI-2E family transporter [Treponema sp.]|nr:AI-2E family transporter [Treponema sp.]